MINSGGVKIYSQAIQDALVLHPQVADSAAIGVRGEEMGESAVAVIEPALGVMPSVALAQELLASLPGKVARFMVPKSVEFIDQR